MKPPQHRKPGRPRKDAQAGIDTRARVMDAAQALIQSQGYNGCSFKDVAEAVGLRTATIHHHFPTKGDLGAAVAERYRGEIRALLAGIDEAASGPFDKLDRFAQIFRNVLQTENRLCLCGILGADVGTLPDDVIAEVDDFFAENEAWLAEIFDAIASEQSQSRDKGESHNLGQSRNQNRRRAQAYLSVLEGAMMVARVRDDVAWFDSTVAGFLETINPIS